MNHLEIPLGVIRLDDQQLEYRFHKVEASIARLERKVNFILSELKLNYQEDDSAVPPELREVAEFLRKGDMKSAIIAFRRQTGATLAGAQTDLQELAAKLN